MTRLRLPAPEAEWSARFDFVLLMRDRLQLGSEDLEHQVGVRRDRELRKVGIEREPIRPPGVEPFVTPRMGRTLRIRGTARSRRAIPLFRLITHGYSILNNWTASA